MTAMGLSARSTSSAGEGAGREVGIDQRAAALGPADVHLRGGQVVQAAGRRPRDPSRSGRTRRSSGRRRKASGARVGVEQAPGERLRRDRVPGRDGRLDRRVAAKAGGSSGRPVGSSQWKRVAPATSCPASARCTRPSIEPMSRSSSAVSPVSSAPAHEPQEREDVVPDDDAPSLPSSVGIGAPARIAGPLDDRRGREPGLEAGGLARRRRP